MTGINIVTDMKDEQRAAVSRASRIDRFPGGQIFSLPNAPAYSVHLITGGSLKYIRLFQDDSEAVSVELAPGAICGRIPRADDQNYPFYLAAVVPVEMWVMSRMDFQKYFIDPHKTFTFKTVAGNIATTTIENPVWPLLYTDISERVISLLLSVGPKIGKETPKGIVISNGLGQGAIAALTGIPKEMVTLTLAGLARRELIDILPHGVVLKNIESLRAMWRRSHLPGEKTPYPLKI